MRQLVRYSSSACVAVLSFLLQPLLCSLSTGESAPTADEATRGVMLKVALAQAFLVVGADSFADLRIHWLSQGTKGWFGSGSVADLSTSWYQTVGGPLSLTLAGVAAVPLFTRLFYTSHRAVRARGWVLLKGLAWRDCNTRTLRHASLPMLHSHLALCNDGCPHSFIQTSTGACLETMMAQ